MAIYNIANNISQSVQIAYYDLDGREQVYELQADATTSLTASTLSPSTLSLASRGIISLGNAAAVVGQIVDTSVPSLRGKGLIWGGYWVANATYQAGWVVSHEGLTYICKPSSLRSASTPPIDTENWQVLSILEPTAFLGISISSVPDGGTFYKSGGAWVADLLGDANINAISMGKVSGLEEALTARLSLAGGTMTGVLSLAGAPTSSLHAATKAYVDLRVPLAGGTMTGALILSGDPIAALQAATKQYADSVAGVPRSGGTMTGALILSGAPASALQAATKAYVDLRVPLAGGTMTGVLVLSGAPTSANHAATKAYVDSQALAGGQMTGNLTLFGAPTSANMAATKAYVDLRVPTAGGTMTGPLVLYGAPTSANMAATKAYVETVASAYVSLAGGTMSGLLTLGGPPTADGHAATKEYVDDTFSGSGGGLALSGGIMTGAITGAHGLLQLDGTLAMTGAIQVASLATSATGIYHSTSYDQLAYRGRMVVQRGVVRSVSSDYAVLAGDGYIKVDASGNSIIVTLGDPTTYPPSDIVIRRFGSNKYLTVTVRGEGLTDYGADLSLNRDRQSVTVFPYSTGWEVVASSTPTSLENEIAWISAAVVNATNKDVTIDIMDREATEKDMSGVSDAGGGEIEFAVSGDPTWQGTTGKVNVITVDGTTDYDGVYEVNSATNASITVTGTFTNSQTGVVRGSARAPVAARAVTAMLSTTVTSPTSGLPTGSSITQVSGGQWLGSGVGGRSATIFSSYAARAIFRVNAPAASVVYVHIVPAGEQWGSIVGHGEAISVAAAHSDAITGVTNQGGGQVGLQLAAVTGWSVGDTVTVSGTAGYNGVYTVASITSNRLVVTATYSSSQTGTATSANAVKLTTPRTSSLQVNEGVLVSSVTLLNGSSAYRTIVERIISGTQFVVRAPVNGAGTTSGTYAAIPVYRLTY